MYYIYENGRNQVVVQRRVRELSACYWQRHGMYVCACISVFVCGSACVCEYIRYVHVGLSQCMLLVAP